MESKIFGSLGKVAGLAGIALGVVLLLFQGVLQKEFLPQAGLGSAEAFAIILSLMILTFGIGGIGVLAWLISGSQNPHAPISGKTLVLLATFMLVIVGAAVFLGWQAKREPTVVNAPQPQVPIGAGAANAKSVSDFDLSLRQTDADIIWSNEVRREIEAIIPRHNARLYVGLGGEKKPSSSASSTPRVIRTGSKLRSIMRSRRRSRLAFRESQGAMRFPRRSTAAYRLIMPRSP